MNKKRYVQHVSGQGEKWEVANEWPNGWHCHTPSGGETFYVPRSEYRECEAPEVWKDVTEDVNAHPEPGHNWHHVTGTNEAAVYAYVPYRLRKVLGRECRDITDDGGPVRDFFIVEKKVQP